MDITVKLHVMAGVRKALPDEESGGFPGEYIPVIEEAAYLIERQRAVIEKVLEDADDWINEMLERDEWQSSNAVAREMQLLVNPLRTLDGGGDE